jgi:hypothetical protein
MITIVAESKFGRHALPRVYCRLVRLDGGHCEQRTGKIQPSETQSKNPTATLTVPRGHQEKSLSQVHSQRDMEIIRKAFAAWANADAVSHRR